MVDFAAARRAMVDSQLVTSGVSNRPLLAAMGRVPRELFVTQGRRDLAYLDDHHRLADGRFLAAPATFARLVQLAAIDSRDSVLDYGAGTGYSTAVLAGLAEKVVGLETNPGLAATARENLAALGISNAIIYDRERDAFDGQRFDVILMEGAIDAMPQELLPMLHPGGRLVALLRRGAIGLATICRIEEGSVKMESYFNATLPPLHSAATPDEFVF